MLRNKQSRGRREIQCHSTVHPTLHCLQRHNPASVLITFTMKKICLIFNVWAALSLKNVCWMINLKSPACREDYLFSITCGSCEDGLITFHSLSGLDWMLLNAEYVWGVFFCIVTQWIQEADAHRSSHSVSINALLCDSPHSSTRLCLVASGASHWDNMLHN